MKKILITEIEKNQILKKHQDFKEILKIKLLESKGVLLEQQLKGNALIKQAQRVCSKLKSAEIIYYPDDMTLALQLKNPQTNEKTIYTSELSQEGDGYNFYVFGPDGKVKGEVETWYCKALSASESELGVKTNEGFYDIYYWRNQNISDETLNNSRYFQQKTVDGRTLYKMTPKYAQTWNVADPTKTAKGEITVEDYQKFFESLGQYNVDQKEWYTYLVNQGLKLKPTPIELRNNLVEKITIYEPGQNASFPNGLTAFVDKSKKVQLTSALNTLLNPNRTDKRQGKKDEKQEQIACRNWINVYLEGYVNNAVDTPLKNSRFKGGPTPEMVKSNVQDCAQKYYKNWDKLKNREGRFLDEVLDLFMRRLAAGRIKYEGNDVYQPKRNSDWMLADIRRR